MDAGGLTLQDLIKRRQAGGFVGRRDEISRFEENLRLPLDDQRRRFLFSVHGDAGVGKSFLVNQFQRIAGERGCATAYVDESVYDIPSVLSGIVRAFARQGDPCKEFTKKSELYHEKRHELDADPATPDGLSSVLTRSAVRIGLRAAEDIPVVGSFAKELDRDAISNQVEKFRAFLSVKLRNQHDVRLLMSPVEELTPIFVNELREVAAKRPVVLFFDTFERTGVFLERWLLDLLDGRYGSLPPNLVLVLAGQHPLDVHAWGDYLGIRADCPLQVFTEEEAREFLAARGVTADEVVEVVLALSGRLPVLLALLAESRPDSAASVADPGDNAVERFLKWEKDEKRKQAALRGALPRQLDRDVFALVADAATPDEDFAWLRRLPFVTERATGYRYHDVVRDTMIRTLRRRSPAEWRERHITLAGYYRTSRADLGFEEEAGQQDERWQELAVEEHYHLLCAGTAAATSDTLAALVETVRARVDQAGRWCAMVRQAGVDAGSEQLMELGMRVGAAVVDGDEDDRAIAILTCLVSERALPSESLTGAYRELGRLYLRDSDFTAAISVFNLVVERYPDAGWALERRGLAHRLAGLYEEALTDLERALELDPDSVSAHNQRGRALRALGRDEEALAEFCRVLELDQDSHYIYRARAATYHSMKRYAEAVEDFTRALEAAPEDTWLIGQRARASFSMKRYAEALADFNRVIESDPDADWALGDRGEVHHAMGHYEDALSDYNRAIEIDPEYSWALGLRGQTYAALGQYTEALADFGRALELAPDSAWASRQRAMLLCELNREDDAVADLSRVIDSDPAAGWARLIRGEVFHQLGRKEEALADFTKAIEMEAGSARAYCLRGITWQSLKRYDMALADFDRAAAIDPASGWVSSFRGQTFRILGRFEEAEVDLKRAQELDGESWDHHQLGLLAYAQGKPDPANESFAAAVRIENACDDHRARHAGTWLNLMVYHLALGEATVAEGMLRQAIERGVSQGLIRTTLEDLEDLKSLVKVPVSFTSVLRAELVQRTEH